MNSKQRRKYFRRWSKNETKCVKCEREATCFSAGKGIWCDVHRPKYLRRFGG